jgi:hypothetical protein
MRIGLQVSKWRTNMQSGSEMTVLVFTIDYWLLVGCRVVHDMTVLWFFGLMVERSIHDTRTDGRWSLLETTKLFRTNRLLLFTHTGNPFPTLIICGSFKTFIWQNFSSLLMCLDATESIIRRHLLLQRENEWILDQQQCFAFSVIVVFNVV